MHIKAKAIGELYTTQHESDIVELVQGVAGLRVIVETQTNNNDKEIVIEYNFDVPRGYRFLDEGDLLRYWKSEVFTHGYHLFEITEGGWVDQETQMPGMLDVTSAVGTFKEWFICTTNGCLNVLSVHPPMVREIEL